MTEPVSLRAAMAALYPRTHGPECADKYRAIAEWWRLHACETRIPEECLVFARKQDAIADDMERRPGHHSHIPLGVSRFQWMQK